jgi:hypothetical protein
MTLPCLQRLMMNPAVGRAPRGDGVQEPEPLKWTSNRTIRMTGMGHSRSFAASAQQPLPTRMQTPAA